ncbi:MAG: hypothetical protein R3D65_19075 [Zhengella sp.]|uniref:DUF6934 family protein n=1 Tax=Zhengella sp. TaxID=2282762 RepID=UPI001DBAA255|nr:hypothetical protein [Notoacmeibacter sp.]MCC0026663.1 hypothetical protein [Brucellaceae bacterium]
MLSKFFEVDHVEYELVIDSAGAVAFAPVQDYPRHEYDLFPENRTDELDRGINALKVFRTVADMVVDHVFENKPHTIYFRAATHRKVRIFRRMVKRLEKKLKKYYYFLEYPEGTFRFYKLTE